MCGREAMSITWRRTSLRSDFTDRESVTDANDYERARKKVERNILLQAGFRSVHLWSAAMKAFVASRSMGMLIPLGAKDREPLSRESGSLDKTVLRTKDVNARSSSQSLSNDMGRLSSSYRLARQASPSQKSSYAATLAVSSPRKSIDSALAITDITNKPVATRVIRVVTGKVQPNGHHGCGKTTQPRALLEGSTERDDNVSSFVKWQQAVLAERHFRQGGASDGYRDRSLHCNLPLPICQQILRHVMSVEDLEILSERQQRKALEWGQLKDTLMTEYNWRNKDKSSQIWMLLEAVDGLVYE